MLSERQLAILDMEREQWRYPGAKDQAISQRFGTTPVGYYQELIGLLGSEAAYAQDPMLITQLRSRLASRSAAAMPRRLT